MEWPSQNCIYSIKRVSCQSVLVWKQNGDHSDFFFFLFFSNDLAKSIGNSTPELFGGILVYEIQKLGTPAVEKPNSAGC